MTKHNTLIINPWKLMGSLPGKRVWIRSTEGKQTFGCGPNRFEVGNHLGLIFEIDPVSALFHREALEGSKFWWVTSALPASMSDAGYSVVLDEAQ